MQYLDQSLLAGTSSIRKFGIILTIAAHKLIIKDRISPGPQKRKSFISLVVFVIKQISTGKKIQEELIFGQVYELAHWENLNI